MHTDNTAWTHSRAALHLETLRQEAEVYQAGKVAPDRKSYRSSLANWLNAAAERLDPNLKPQHLGS